MTCGFGLDASGDSDRVVVRFSEGTIAPGRFFAGAVRSAAADLDVLGFSVEIGYDHMLGHRGLTHSVTFAAALAACVGFIAFRHDESGAIDGKTPKSIRDLC